MCAVYALWTRLSARPPLYGADAARISAGRDVGRWPWMAHARRTVVLALFSMCFGVRQVQGLEPHGRIDNGL